MASGLAGSGRRGRLLLFPIVLYVVGLASAPAAAQTHTDMALEGTTHLIAIGVCPRYRKHIPVEICRTAVNRVTSKLPPALGIAKGNVTSLVDEATSASNVLATRESIGAKLGASDRLVVYLVLHGDAFHLWADFSPSARAPEIAAVNRSYFAGNEDLMVFWTKEEPTVPALALAEGDWMTVNDFAAALRKLPGHVALILDSCSSNLFFSSVHGALGEGSNIDFVLTSAGASQVSNFDSARTIPLLTGELLDALDLPSVRRFGEAVATAQRTTMLHATATCSLETLKASEFGALFAPLPVPAERTHDDMVSPPLWYCAQVPGVVDISGAMSARLLYPEQP